MPSSPARRVPARALLLGCPIALVAASVPFHRMWSALPAAPLLPIVAAACLYGLSHLLRAVRLAIIAGPALNLRLRTVISLHFFTAPVSFIVPFKLGELFRLQQLAWLSQNRVGALIVLVMERMLDAFILLLVFATMFFGADGLPPRLTWLVWLLASISLLGIWATFVAPAGLEAMQTYVVRHHSSRPARRLLFYIDSARVMTMVASRVLRGHSLSLLTLSAAIWAAESAVIIILANAVDPGLPVSTSLLTLTVVSSVAGQSLPAVMSLYEVVCLATLLLIWGGAARAYLHCIRDPRRRPVAADAVLTFQPARRVRLRAAARFQ